MRRDRIPLTAKALRLSTRSSPRRRVTPSASKRSSSICAVLRDDAEQVAEAGECDAPGRRAPHEDDARAPRKQRGEIAYPSPTRTSRPCCSRKRASSASSTFTGIEPEPCFELGRLLARGRPAILPRRAGTASPRAAPGRAAVGPPPPTAPPARGCPGSSGSADVQTPLVARSVARRATRRRRSSRRPASGPERGSDTSPRALRSNRSGHRVAWRRGVDARARRRQSFPRGGRRGRRAQRRPVRRAGAGRIGRPGRRARAVVACRGGRARVPGSVRAPRPRCRAGSSAL